MIYTCLELNEKRKQIFLCLIKFVISILFDTFYALLIRYNAGYLANDLPFYRLNTVQKSTFKCNYSTLFIKCRMKRE